MDLQEEDVHQCRAADGTQEGKHTFGGHQTDKDFCMYSPAASEWDRVFGNVVRWTAEILNRASVAVSPDALEVLPLFVDLMGPTTQSVTTRNIQNGSKIYILAQNSS